MWSSIQCLGEWRTALCVREWWCWRGTTRLSNEGLLMHCSSNAKTSRPTWGTTSLRNSHLSWSQVSVRRILCTTGGNRHDEYIAKCSHKWAQRKSGNIFISNHTICMMGHPCYYDMTQPENTPAGLNFIRLLKNPGRNFREKMQIVIFFSKTLFKEL
jgi:hypothetical protein